MSARMNDLELAAAESAMAREMPYGWQWAVVRDSVGLVCAAWRDAAEYPESVYLEARSAGDLADEIAVYLDGLQAALEIARGQGGRVLEQSHGTGSKDAA